ncbi:MAG: O-antigen ligase family protein [Geminicoccaceae bacterium]|nr:O-antigen ligase family protein [Geminicoccaceae bacterium]
MTTPDPMAPTARISLGDLLVVTTVLVFSSDILEITLRGAGLGAGVQMSYLVLYAAAFIVALSTGTPGGLLRACPLVMALIALPVLSIAWSLDPRESLERAIGLVGSSVFALFLGWHHAIPRLVRLVAWGMILNVILSAIAIVALPSIGIDHSTQWAGTWIGIHNHKNELGGSMGLAIMLLCYTIFDARAVLRWFLAGMLGLSFLLLLGSASATSLVTTAASVALMLLFLALAKTPAIARLFLLLFVLLIPLLALIAWQTNLVEFALEALGKDANLSSRVDIWRLVWPYVEDRYWLGYGYGVFWQEDLPWMDQMEARLHFAPFYSHNGIIETWIGGGIVLVILTILVYAAGLFKAFVKVAREPHDLFASFPLVFLLVFILRNITESALLNRNNIFWSLFLAMIALLARDVRLRLRTAPADMARG